MLHRLILLRHGEAEMSSSEDHARRLTSRGETQARAAGEALAACHWRPDHALVSDATRAKRTYELAAEALGTTKTPLYLEDLYLAPHSKIMRVIAGAELPPGGTLLCVGHNPGWSDLASRLSGEVVGLAPANAALLQIEAESWEEAMMMAPAWDLVKLV